MTISPLKVRFTFANFIFLIFLSSAVWLQADDIKVRIITQKATLYLKPTKESLEILTLPMGSIHSVVGTFEDWYQIETPPDKNGITVQGFIHESQVEHIIREEQSDPLGNPVKTRTHVQEAQEKQFEPSEGIRIGVGMSIGSTLPTENHYNAGPNFGGSLLFLPVEFLALELNCLYSQSATENNTTGLSEGNLSTFEIGLNLIGRFPIKNKFFPYISAGGFYSLNSFKLDADLASTWDNLGFDLAETVENASGARFGAGVDFRVAGKITLGLDFKYRLMVVEGAWTFTDQLSNTAESGALRQLNFNSLSLSLGIKYFF